MANRYGVPIVATPFTIEVIKTILRDEKIKIKNELKVMNANSQMKVSKNLSLEFVNITHSTPQTVLGVLHTPDGAVVYANDFKLDSNPILGTKPNFDRMRQLGAQGVDILSGDWTRHKERKNAF
jgi:ribonuclease J